MLLLLIFDLPCLLTLFCLLTLIPSKCVFWLYRVCQMFLPNVDGLGLAGSSQYIEYWCLKKISPSGFLDYITGFSSTPRVKYKTFLLTHTHTVLSTLNTLTVT